MSINSLPDEILYSILEEVVKLNEKDGVVYTYGLSKLPPSSDSTVPTKLQRYVRGPTPPYQMKWDATADIRMVCAKWHSWALEYAVHDVYVKIWQKSERWFDLTTQREKYPFYELNHPKGEPCYRSPFATLMNTEKFLKHVPEAAALVRRLWFNGLYIPETDAHVVSILRLCPNLRSITIPWTVLRTASPADWAGLLGTNSNNSPLHSLELHMITPSSIERAQIMGKYEEKHRQLPLLSPAVDFSSLTRLKLLGSTNTLPICDQDLFAIARTATHIEEFHLTCTDGVSIDGVMAIVRASRKSLRVLEHSPRADHGFWHPDPGHTSDGAHICELLADCPRLTDISVSLPSMCASLFANDQVRWRGDCQVRALELCGVDDKRSNEAHATLRGILKQARQLIAARGRGTLPAKLTLELFYANMIFDPHAFIVHGDFEEGEVFSQGRWPAHKEMSRKGPYGSTGLYGKMEEEVPYSMIEEDDLFAGLSRNLVRL